MAYELTDNQDKKQYEIQVDGKTVRLEYIKTTGKIFLTHTEVPQGLEGRGLGSQIIGQVLEEVKKNDWELVPMCPFVAGYIKKHPEWKALVLKGINIE